MSQPPKHQMSELTTTALCARIPFGIFPLTGVTLQYIAVGGASLTSAWGRMGTFRVAEMAVVLVEGWIRESVGDAGGERGRLDDRGVGPIVEEETVGVRSGREVDFEMVADSVVVS